MDYNATPTTTFWHSLTGLSINLLARDVATEVVFLTQLFGMQAHRQSADFAIVLYQGKPIPMAHSPTTRYTGCWRKQACA